MFSFNQSRCVCCVFYSHDDLLMFIKDLHFDNGRYAYIYHDRDKNKDGTDKEPHYHMYGYRSSPITQQTLSNFSARCEQNVFFQNLKSTESHFLAYFTHDEIDDKEKYSIDEIQSNFDVDVAINTRINDKIDPAEIVSLFGQGFTTLQIIRKFPKLIYSIASLQRFERLVFEEHRLSKIKDKPPTPVQIALVPVDCPDIPF